MIGQRIKRLLLGLSVSFSSIGVALLVLELILRLGMPLHYPVFKTCQGSQSLTKFDPELKDKLTPNGVYLIKHTSEDAWDLYTHDELGIREVHDSGSSAVLVFGDSMTYGLLVSDESTFVHLLDKWSGDVRFKNYGVPGYGTAQELLSYRQVADSIDHDLVILGYFPNDPVDNVTPDLDRFTLVDGQLVLGPPLIGRGLITVGWVDKLQRTLADHTATYHFAHPKLRRILAKFGANGDLAITDEQQREGVEKTTGDGFSLTRALIKELAEETRLHRARLLVVAITPLAAVRSDVLESGRPIWDKHLDMLAEIAKESPGVDLLDLTPFIVDEITRGNRVYGKSDAHLDDYGHYVAARAILNRLVENAYVNKPAESNLYFDESAADVDRCPLDGHK